MHKLQASAALRQDKLRHFLAEARQGREFRGGCVCHGISSTLFSVDFARLDSDSSHQEIIQGLMKIAGTPNIADFFPVLRLVDPQGIKRKGEDYFGKLFHKFDEIITERLQEREKSTDSPKKKDLLQLLLDLNQEDDAYLSCHDIKHLLSDLFVAGTDTTTDSVQWAMAELIRNPDKLSKTKNELTSVMGERTQVEEDDIPKLPYLNAVIKESFRLHPPGPFLIPHKAEADVEIDGYTYDTKRCTNTRECVGHWKRLQHMARSRVL